LGKGLGVVATDVNNDGRMDLFVANDTVQNFLFMNRGKDRQDQVGGDRAGGRSGLQRQRPGSVGMGVDAADFDGDGWQDLFVANVDQEMFSLYKNKHERDLQRRGAQQNMAQATRLLSGWGFKFFDYDNDGASDLILANGHPDDMIDNYSQQVKYKEPLLLFHNENGVLRNVSAERRAGVHAIVSGARIGDRRLQ
jgi:enediyne biosynthesis protein E4